ncbi:MAG: PaaI family thioesterase [Alphaproteobacteria bacterium]
MAEAWPRAGMALHFGIRIVAGDKEKVIGELDADERHVNARGIVHGGAYMAFADELGGQAAHLNLPPGTTTTTIESKTNFFRASQPGRLRAEAVPLHVGRRTIVVQTSIYGPDGKRAAMVTQTQLVIPKEQQHPPA